MKIVPIFANRLYAFHYQNGDDPDEFERLFDLWQDITYLEQFFDENQKDLARGFFVPVPTVDEAVLITQEEATRLERHLKQLARLQNQQLDAFFKPLSKTEDHLPFPRYKTYGLRYNSWLRIYALKIGHRYYITGGAIKLTRAMQDAAHTQAELDKISRCFSYFREQGVVDIDGAMELDL